MNEEKPIKFLKGVNGQLSVYEDRIVISRKGALSKMTQGFFKGDKTIYTYQITSIQVKKGGMVTNGYIQFSIGGGNESSKGIIDATKDENTIMFNKKFNSLVYDIKEFIEVAMNNQRNPFPTNQSVSTADELIKLKSLLDDGILSQEEFDAQKKKLLS
jgi:hypothetical protein